MKTVKGSTTHLTPFQETISLIYDIDPKNKGRLDTIEQESTILYYVSDMQYTILKRDLETKLGRSLNFEEFNTIISRQNYRFEFPTLQSLTKEDYIHIYRDLSYLAKYNELYQDLACSYKVLELLKKVYSGDLDAIISFGPLLEQVKRHQILVKLGIEQHLKTENKSLDEKLTMYRSQNQKTKNPIMEIISATIAKTHAR